ncbi:MAG: cysteine desulfurase [Candidatus Eremiobacteraeota bacterium]|nr:cysteine desulfurase [Candidatus Eremiobacteraeota bacterium]
MSDWLYLDHNASTPMARSVVEKMQDCLAWQAHPSSSHPHGRDAAQAVDQARSHIAEALGCREKEIVICSGSTEAANHVIKGVCFSRLPENPLHFISSAVDHAATTKPLEFLQRLGHQVTLLPVDRTGRISPADLESALQDNTALVTLIHGQNEVGTVQPLAEIGSLLRRHPALFHVDASQSFGKVPVNVDTLGADFLNIAGHKIYGPKGVGALYVRDGLELEPLLHGGGHESGRRSGTPAPQLAAGLGEACALVNRLGLLSPNSAEALWSELSSGLGDDVKRNGDPSNRLPNVVHATFKGVSGRELLDAANISASTGAACHSASVSPVLSAMGFTAEEARGSVRLSTGRDTTTEVAVAAGKALVNAYRQLRAEIAV